MIINLWAETTRYLVLHVFTKPQAKVEWWDFADAFQEGDQITCYFPTLDAKEIRFHHKN